LEVKSKRVLGTRKDFGGRENGCLVPEKTSAEEKTGAWYPKRLRRKRKRVPGTRKDFGGRENGCLATDIDFGGRENGCLVPEKTSAEEKTGAWYLI
jgi:hypothetical protein